MNLATRILRYIKTYRDGNTLVIRARRELDDEFRPRLLLSVIEGPEPADDLDGVLGGCVGSGLSLAVSVIRHRDDL